MQHITTADKTFLVGTELAGLLMRYAALIAQLSGGDAVQINSIGADGDEVVATLLLNSGTVMASESVHSSAPEPENRAAEEYLRGRLASFADFPAAFPTEGEG